MMMTNMNQFDKMIKIKFPAMTYLGFLLTADHLLGVARRGLVPCIIAASEFLAGQS